MLVMECIRQELRKRGWSEDWIRACSDEVLIMTYKKILAEEEE